MDGNVIMVLEGIYLTIDAPCTCLGDIYLEVFSEIT